jgi:hypothetical protein
MVNQFYIIPTNYKIFPRRVTKKGTYIWIPYQNKKNSTTVVFSFRPDYNPSSLVEMLALKTSLIRKKIEKDIKKIAKIPKSGIFLLI